ncbi:hypothetical protein DYH09_27435 [bacterium CPR1]|nr:hypothetical protein [bacterium CPR1]
MRRLAGLLLIMGLLCPARSEEARLVVRVSGKVDSRQSDESMWRPIFASRLLGLQDWTRTGAESKARVHLEKGLVITLGPITQVRVADVSKGEQGVGSVNIVVPTGNNFQVRTPSATLAVRGTDFDSFVEAQAPVPDQTVIGALRSPFEALTASVPTGVSGVGPVDWQSILLTDLAAARAGGQLETQRALISLASALQASERVSPEAATLIKEAMKIGSATYVTRLGVREGAVEYQALDEEGNPLGPIFLCQAGQSATIMMREPAVAPLSTPDLLPSPLIVRSTSTEGDPRDPQRMSGSNFSDPTSYLPFLPTTATLRTVKGSSSTSNPFWGSSSSGSSGPPTPPFMDSSIPSLVGP